MATVTAIEGITYGFRLLAYFIAIFLGGGGLVGIGSLLTEFSQLLGGLVVLSGGLILFAGQAGVLYKVIADGVEQGMNSASN